MNDILVFCDNHMDVVWRRGCREHYRSVDGFTRPYSDLEEEQIRRALHRADSLGCRYTLEQSLPLKLFLERNPDLLPTVQRLVDTGMLELPGGGETLIDLNMVCGESLVRNHLYSILWCERTFGKRPTTATGTDLFGYSAQVPQILNKLGYHVLANTSRLMDDGTPFWRGLDGSVLLIRPTWQNLGLPQVFAPGGCTRPPAPCCHGEGCPVCGFRGMDISDENVRSDDALDRLFERIKGAEPGPVVLRISGEETLENDKALAHLLAKAQESGLTLRSVTMTELVDAIDAERLARMRAGTLDEAEILPDAEQNPVCTGCYVTRIKLKQWNRRLENMLLAAETFAAFASPSGTVYPRRKLERLWNDMALLQFHDAITGSHSDGAYDELLGLCRNIARDAWQVYEDGTNALTARVSVSCSGDRRAAVVFNPLPWAVEGTPVDIALDVSRGERASGVDVVDARNQPVAVTDVTPVQNVVGGRLAVRLTGLKLPPCGYGTIHYRFTETPPSVEVLDGNVIENEFYQVTLSDRGVARVIDKESNETLAGDGAGGLLFEEDYGSPWETLARPSFSCWVAQHSTPSRTLTGNADVRTAVFEGEFRNPRIQQERRIARISWRQEVTLYAGVKRIYLKTTVDWDTHNGRLMLAFPLGFRPSDDEAHYAVPFGVLPRKRYDGEFGIHTKPNGDWPGLDVVACRHPEKDLWVTVANKGTPCYRLENGVLKMTVVRSPCIPLSSVDIEGAREVGAHVFEAVIASHTGDLQAVNPVRIGREFNTPFIAATADPATGGTLPADQAFLGHDTPSLHVTAVKRAEDGDDLVVRICEPYGVETNMQLTGVDPEQIRETDLLERGSREVEALHFSPYEIKTIRIDSGG